MRTRLRSTTGVAQTLATLGSLADDQRTRWEATRESLGRLRKSLAQLHGMDEFGLGSEFQLINLPENIVPGRLDQIQGAETALSRSLRPMDVAIGQLNQIVDKEALPAKPSERTNAKRYDSTTDELFAALLQPITQASTRWRMPPNRCMTPTSGTPTKAAG